jgi:hypothetical protein
MFRFSNDLNAEDPRWFQPTSATFFPRRNHRRRWGKRARRGRLSAVISRCSVPCEADKPRVWRVSARRKGPRGTSAEGYHGAVGSGFHPLTRPAAPARGVDTDAAIGCCWRRPNQSTRALVAVVSAAPLATRAAPAPALAPTRGRSHHGIDDRAPGVAGRRRHASPSCFLPLCIPTLTAKPQAGPNCILWTISGQSPQASGPIALSPS